MADYERAPKRRFTRLLLDVAQASDCRTFAGLWGLGGESRLAVAAGLKVLAVDNDPETFAAMADDGARFGYETFSGNARLLRRHVDMWHADFMGTPNPDNFRTVRHLSHLTDRWLAVTLATDHMKNVEMQGDPIVATLPAWLTFAAEGFTLEYLSTYLRNERGLRMWVAILRRKSGKGVSYVLHPVQISWSMAQRGYWASRLMYAEHPNLLPRRTGVASDSRTEYLHRRYRANRERLLAASRKSYIRNREHILANQRARMASPEAKAKFNAYSKEWRKKHPKTPEQVARTKETHRAWYLRNRDAMIAAEAARRAKRRAARHGEAAI